MQTEKKFRGDTILNRITGNGYVFQPGDVLKIAVMKFVNFEHHEYDAEITVAEEQDAIEFDPRELILEIQLTTAVGVRVTYQEKLDVKEDGIK